MRRRIVSFSISWPLSSDSGLAMLNRSTLARPYARAAFASAREHGSLDRWSANLQCAAAVAVQEPVPELLQNPRLSRDQVLSLFAEVGGERFDSGFHNFLKTLAQYRRLPLLPEVSAQFEALRREDEARVHVLVTSAQAITDDEAERLSERLRQRFGREIELEIKVDASLIGGAVIKAQDEVIDGSVRGQLERLARQVAA